MEIYALRTTIGQERAAARLIAKRAEDKGTVSSVLVPDALKGYIFIEAESLESVEDIVANLPAVRKRPVKERTIHIDELSDILVPRPAVEGIKVGYIVEVTMGPFRGARAKITKVDSNKEEVTVELLDSDIPIPVKLHGDYVRVIDSASDKEEAFQI